MSGQGEWLFRASKALHKGFYCGLLGQRNGRILHFNRLILAAVVQTTEQRCTQGDSKDLLEFRYKVMVTCPQL